MRSVTVLVTLMLTVAWIGQARSADQTAPSTAPADDVRVLTTAAPPKDPSTKFSVVMKQFPQPTTQEVMQAALRLPVEKAAPADSFNRPGGMVIFSLLRMGRDAKPEQPEGADILQVVYAGGGFPGIQPHPIFSAALIWTDEGTGYLVLSQFKDHHLTLAVYTIPAEGKPIGQYPLDPQDRPKPATPLDEFMDWLPGYESIAGVNVKAEGGKLIAQVARSHLTTGAPVEQTTNMEFDPSSGKWRSAQ